MRFSSCRRSGGELQQAGNVEHGERPLGTAEGRDEGAPPAGGRYRCVIPLTERTVDGAHYYPCSVYAREGGAPLGPVGDPPAVQRARSLAFVQGGDCLADRICRRYCLHCTRTFNALVNGP